MKWIFALLFVSPVALAEKIKVITTFPELAEIAREIGGEHVQAEALLTGLEDPHFLDAVPSFIRKVSTADVFCQVGLDLEIGWAPKVLARSGNAKIQPGGAGFCDTGKGVSVLEKPTGTVDRSMGDVHPQGNPHFNLDPLALGQAARIVTDALVAARPSEKSVFEDGLKKFQKRMQELHKNVSAKISKRPLLIEYHREFSYFLATYKLQSFGAIEEKPGVPPSASYLATRAKAAQQAGVQLAVASLYSPEKQLRKFSELSGIPYKALPTMVQPLNEKLNTIEKLQYSLVDAL